MKGKNLVLVFIFVMAVAILPPLVRASETGESAEHTEVVEAQGEHVVAEGHEVEAEEHGVVAEEHVAEGHGVGHGEPWWRFTGWEVVFAVLATVFFLFLTRWLPLILEDKSGGSSL